MSRLVLPAQVRRLPRHSGPGPEKPITQPPNDGIEGVRATAGLQSNSPIASDLAAFETDLGRPINFTTNNMGFQLSGAGNRVKDSNVIFVREDNYRARPEVTVCATLATLLRHSDTVLMPPVATRQAEYQNIIDGDWDSDWQTIADRAALYVAHGFLTRTSTGGTVTITVNGNTTATIPATSAGFTATAVEDALNVLTGFQSTVVAGVDGGPLYIDWPDAIPTPTVSVNNASATGGTVTYSTTGAVACPPPILRIAHESEVLSYPWSKMGVAEATFSGALEYLYDFFALRIPGVRFDYHGDGPWLRTTWAEHVQNNNSGKGTGHPQYVTPPVGGDSRLVYEYGMPDLSTHNVIFGTDLYIGKDGRPPSEFLTRVSQLQQLAFDFGVQFSIPEFGASPNSREGQIGLVDNDPAQPELSVKKWMEDLITLLASFPASGPGSCAYWSYFEENNNYKMRTYWPQTWARYCELIGPN